MPPFSILDLSRVVQGATAAAALRDTLELAQHAERLGYRRFWVAEHHNMSGIASAATPVVIGYIAANTYSIRLGSGGVMLPNHAPLVVAEQFGTLASLYPDRIDLGLGRAPGTDMLTARALRRDMGLNAENFPHDVIELQSYFAPTAPGPEGTRRAGRGARSAALAARLKYFQCAVGGATGSAFRLCRTLRAGRDGAGAVSLSPEVHAFVATRTALRHDLRECAGC